MPRRNSRRAVTANPKDLSFLANGGAQMRTLRGREYSYRTIAAQQAVKTYTCPGCGSLIGVGVAHVVAWQADSIWGDAAAIADRRHWHTHCWKLA